MGMRLRVLTGTLKHAEFFFTFHVCDCFFLHRQTLDEMKLEIKPIKIDRRLTGSSFIDEPLQQVCLSDFFPLSYREDQ